MDLIDRQSAIDALTKENLFKHMDTVNDGGQENRSAIRIIKSLPSAQQWIPCSKRLPVEYEVLCCNTHKDIIIGNPYKDETTNTGFGADNENEYLYDCIAWMSLPEPYEEEKRDERID